MQDSIKSGMDFIVTSVEGFQPLTDIAKDSGVLWGSCISFSYYSKVSNIFDQEDAFCLSKVFSKASLSEYLSHVAATCGFLLGDAFGEKLIYYYCLVFSVKSLMYLQ